MLYLYLALSFVVAPTNYDVIGNENGEYEDL